MVLIRPLAEDCGSAARPGPRLVAGVILFPDASGTRHLQEMRGRHGQPRGSYEIKRSRSSQGPERVRASICSERTVAEKRCPFAHLSEVTGGTRTRLCTTRSLDHFCIGYSPLSGTRTRYWSSTATCDNPFTMRGGYGARIGYLGLPDWTRLCCSTPLRITRRRHGPPGRSRAFVPTLDHPQAPSFSSPVSTPYRI